MKKTINPHPHPTPAPVDPFPNPVLAPPDSAGLNIEGARFGCTRDNGTTEHKGLDIKAPVGTDFVSIFPGTVQDIRDDVSNNEHTPNSVGNFVIVRTRELKISIKYCHLSKVAVKVGDKVTQSTVLGKTGRSGNAFNAPFKHIHIEVSTDYFATNRNYVDPEKYLKTTYGPNSNPTECP